MAEQGGGGPTGIKLGVTWPEALATLVIERDTSGGFGSAVEIARLSSVVTTYTDDLSINGVTYHYRSKHVKSGSADSAWSSGVSDTPHDL